jgi:predicted nucleotidyltransferase
VTDFASLIRRLSDVGIDFILIGGIAATVHGSARLTRDVDVP